MGPQRLGLSDKAKESPPIHEKFITKPSFFSFKTIPRFEKHLPISLVSTISLGFIKASPSTWQEIPHIRHPWLRQWLPKASLARLEATGNAFADVKALEPLAEITELRRCFQQHMVQHKTHGELDLDDEHFFPRFFNRKNNQHAHLWKAHQKK